jgi:hypothetical protein
MQTPPMPPTLTWDPTLFSAHFDREPFGFEHNLAALDLFKFDGLVALAEKYGALDQEYFVAGSAPSPGTGFYTVPTVSHRPHEALERLEQVPYRVLLKRPENLDPRFRDLLDQLWHQVVQSRAALLDQKIVRLESAIFISSAAATTPFHFDPEVNFFSQIEGEKTYHVYPPDVVSETELERFYKRGIVNIGQVDLSTRPRDRERVFTLAAGRGLHQPQNAPHWVETGASRSISYSFVFETAASRALGRTRSCNHYLRKLGLAPARPGMRPVLDGVKSEAMHLAIPVRRSLARSARAVLGHRS